MSFTASRRIPLTSATILSLQLQKYSSNHGHQASIAKPVRWYKKIVAFGQRDAGYTMAAFFVASI